MKKFISMVMAAAMVVSLVPATAFAANEASFKVVDDKEWTEKSYVKDAGNMAGTQIQLKIKDVDTNTNVADKFEVKLSFDNIEAINTKTEDMDWSSRVKVLRDQQGVDTKDLKAKATLEAYEKGDEKFTIVIEEPNATTNFAEGDIIVIELGSAFKMMKDNDGAVGTVKVSGDFGTSDEMTVASILDEAIDVEVDDTVDVAVEEVATLEDITIEPKVVDTFGEMAKDADEITLKLNKGFEFVGDSIKCEDELGNKYTFGKNDGVEVDEDKITIKLSVPGCIEKFEELIITGLQIEAVSAKEGDVATLTVKIDDADSVKVEVATVCEYKVVMSVEEDEDVPVYYSGVNAANAGLTVDEDHDSLVVTIEETFAGAWSMHKDLELSLPEGVYVVDVDVEDNSMYDVKDLKADFANAYQEGDHTSFVFEKRTWNETDPDATGVKADAQSMEFTLELVADPGFVGDVVLTMEGDAVDTQEVTIAKFVSPIAVKAEQNDLKIDYRYTEVGTDIVVTEAEAGLWDTDLTIGFQVEKGDYIVFEDDATFTVNEGSDMEIEDKTDDKNGRLYFTVEEESDEEAAVVTISNVELFMQRNIPAGPYDLDMYFGAKGVAEEAYKLQGLFAPDCVETYGNCVCGNAIDKVDGECDHNDDCECVVGDVCDYSETVKEAWINVVTAGREADDASFTTKVVVPVGEAYIIAGEAQVALDVPAYVNAAGYTMLPVRAVAVALGINTQNVLWDQATKTVTILYGQRIITMQVGAKVVYVNGSAIPASASVEIVDGRTFLPMRDLATALGVTDITWDAATKTATLNGNA